MREESEVIFRYFKLDMPLKTAKYKWQEVIWIGGSEGQGLPLFVGAAITNHQRPGGLNSECLFLEVVEAGSLRSGSSTVGFW